MGISVLVLEDEEYTRKYLIKLVEQHSGVGEVWGVGSGEAAVDIAATHHPTLALLDVELGTGDRHNGIQVAEEISQQSPETKYIFITGYAKYALDSFVVHPFDYLLKPVDRNRLQKTLQAVIELSNDQKAATLEAQAALSLKRKGGTDVIPFDEIIFVESANRQTLVHTLFNCYSSYHSLQYYTNLLPEAYFLQLHKSFIVNKTKIAGIQEIGHRSYQVHFHNTAKTALMSRQHYLEHRHLLISMPL